MGVVSYVDFYQTEETPKASKHEISFSLNQLPDESRINYFGVTSHTAAVWLAYVDTGHTATYLINTHLQLIS